MHLQEELELDELELELDELEGSSLLDEELKP